MFRPYTLAELTGLTEEQLIAAHDVAVGQTIVGAEYYLEEIRNRRQSRRSRQCGKAYAAYLVADPVCHCGDDRERLGNGRQFHLVKEILITSSSGGSLFVFLSHDDRSILCEPGSLVRVKWFLSSAAEKRGRSKCGE